MFRLVRENEKNAFKNGETHRFGRSLMIPNPHRAISGTYTTQRNASTAWPGKHRVVRAETLLAPRFLNGKILEKREKKRKPRLRSAANAAERFDV